MTYEQFRASFFKARKKGDSREPMSEKDFNEMMGIGFESRQPLEIKPKRDARKVAASFENHIKIVEDIKRNRRPKSKAVKTSKDPKPHYRPKKTYTAEEIKERRAEALKIKRANNKAKGLTVDGKPRATPKPKKSIEEIREARARYARTWRKNNREHYIAYKKDQYAKSKNKKD